MQDTSIQNVCEPPHFLPITTSPPHYLTSISPMSSLYQRFPAVSQVTGASWDQKCQNSGSWGSTPRMAACRRAGQRLVVCAPGVRHCTGTHLVPFKLIICHIYCRTKTDTYSTMQSTVHDIIHMLFSRNKALEVVRWQTMIYRFLHTLQHKKW